MRIGLRRCLALRILSAAAAECGPLEAVVSMDGVDIVARVTSSSEIAVGVERVCAAGDLRDADCGSLHAHVRARWREERADCEEEASVARPLAELGSEQSPVSRELREEDADFEKDARPLPLERAASSQAQAQRCEQPPAMDALLGSFSLDKPPDSVAQPPPPGWKARAWTPPPLGVAVEMARAVTARWRASGVRRSEVTAAAEADADCALLQVIGGTVWVVASPEKLRAWDASAEARPWRERRRLAVVELALDVAQAVGGDVEVAFCPTDCVVASDAFGDGNASFYAHHGAAVGALPALTVVGCAGSHNVPFPAFHARSADLNESLANWDRLTTTLMPTFRVAWRDREARAIFRGRIHGQSCWTGGADEGLAAQRDARCGRRRLRAKAAEFPERFDVGDNHVPLFLQHHRYQIYAEGHCGWSDRLRFQLHMGAALMLQETFCREFVALGLEPWVHYLPLDYHFEHLAATHAWAESHQADVQRIVANARAYADHALNAAAIRSYALGVLAHLRTAARYVASLREHAVPAEDFLRERSAMMDRLAAAAQ